jgi:Flp pilus assembly protein TadG
MVNHFKSLDQPAKQRGSVLVLILVFMVALLAFAALSIDVSLVLSNRKRVQDACDAAALAAVVDWAQGESPGFVNNVGRLYAQTNSVANLEVLAVDTGYWNNSTKSFVGPLTSVPPNTVPAVRVIAQRTVNLAFGKIIGISNMKPKVQSVAIVAAATAAARVLPWGVCDTFVPVECTTITLQFKSGVATNACSSSGGLSGNFGQLTLPGGSGSSWYKSNIEDGYPGLLHIGDCFPTDPGVSWGPTKQGIDDRIGGLPPFNCSPGTVPDNDRLAIVPKVSTIDLSGKKETCITGFYVIALNAYNNGQKSVTATFLNVYAGSEVDPSAPPVPGELAGIALVK